MILDEINELISSMLELYKKRRVDGDTPEVSKLAEKLVAFATRYSLEDELHQLREAHLPTRSNQKMTVETRIRSLSIYYHCNHVAWKLPLA